jgi:hypothetical protein
MNVLFFADVEPKDDDVRRQSGSSLDDDSTLEVLGHALLLGDR